MFDLMVGLFSQFVASLLDIAASYFMTIMVNAQDLLDKYLPGLPKYTAALRWISVAIMALLMVFAIIKMIRDTALDDNPTNPIKVIVSWLTGIAATIFCVPILRLIMRVVAWAFQFLLTNTDGADKEAFVSNTLPTFLKGITAIFTGNHALAGLSNPFFNMGSPLSGANAVLHGIMGILLIVLAYNLIKFMIQILQRYIVMQTLVYTSPLICVSYAADFGGNIRAGWWQLFKGQAISFILGAWGLKVALYSLEQPIEEGVSGNAYIAALVLKMIFVIVFLQICNKTESYVKEIGLRSVNSNRDFMDEAMMLFGSASSLKGGLDKFKSHGNGSSSSARISLDGGKDGVVGAPAAGGNTTQAGGGKAACGRNNTGYGTNHVYGTNGTAQRGGVVGAPAHSGYNVNPAAAPADFTNRASTSMNSSEPIGARSYTTEESNAILSGAKDSSGQSIGADEAGIYCPEGKFYGEFNDQYGTPAIIIPNNVTSGDREVALLDNNIDVKDYGIVGDYATVFYRPEDRPVSYEKPDDNVGPKIVGNKE